MTAPTPAGAATPYEGMTFGDLLELAFNREGLTYDGSDPAKPPAKDPEKARMKRIVKECLTTMQTRFANVFGDSEAETTAVSDYSAVGVPADFGHLIGKGLSINGVPIDLISTRQWAESRRPAAQGGGTTLAAVSGAPSHARLAVKEPSAADERRVYIAIVYPAQTAAFTAHWIYKATARNLTDDDDAIRCPVELHPVLLQLVAAAYAERGDDIPKAASRTAMFDRSASEQENLPPTDDTPNYLRQGIPNDIKPLDL